MPRKVNRKKKHTLSYDPLPPPRGLLSTLSESLFKILIYNRNYLINKHTYFIIIIPIIYTFYNLYKT